MLLTRDEILASKDIAASFKTVAVPEWGGEVLVRVMTGTEREAFEEILTSPKPSYNLRAYLASACLCDPTGQLLFSKDDVLALGQKSSKALSRVYQVASDVNKLSKSDVEILEKNSDPAI